MRDARRPRWLWRVLLTIPAASCLLAFFLWDGPLLDDRHAHLFAFQVQSGCLIFGAMPDPDVLERWAATAEKHSEFYKDSSFVCIHPPNAVIQPCEIFLECIDARKEGWLATGPGNGQGECRVVIALWLVAIPPALLALPLLHAIRLTWRRARWRKRNRCVTCGYQLDGLLSPRCPECGQSFRPAGAMG